MMTTITLELILVLLLSQKWLIMIIYHLPHYYQQIMMLKLCMKVNLIFYYKCHECLCHIYVHIAQLSLIFYILIYHFCFSLLIVEVNQDGSVVNITPGPLYLQELNGDETQTLLKNINANLNTDHSYYMSVSDILCANQLMTVGYNVSHFTNPCMFTPIIQLVLFFLFIFNLITFPFP